MNKYSIEDLKNEDWFDYLDNDIFLINDIKKLPLLNASFFEVDMMLIIFCTGGNAEITINDKPIELKPNRMVVCMPHSIFRDYKPLTDDFDTKILGLSTRSFDLPMYSSKNVWKSFFYVYTNPVVDLSEHDIQLLTLYYEIARMKIDDGELLYRNEITSSLLHGFIYELLCIINKQEGNGTGDTGMSRGDLLFRRFLELLSKHDGKVRSVAEFADELCVSPKYLGTVVKEASGRTALELIHETAAKAIVRRLKYTDKSIKEISNEMQFSSLSFFGKFVKSQLGVPPKVLRRED